MPRDAIGAGGSQRAPHYLLHDFVSSVLDGLGVRKPGQTSGRQPSREVLRPKGWGQRRLAGLVTPRWLDVTYRNKGSQLAQKPGIIIIPAYNEEPSIGCVLQEIHRFKLPYEVVVVDDGSTDRTAEVSRQCGVSVISHPCNLGYGGAIQTGLKYALKKGYNLAILMDGDGQHDPADIERLVMALRETRSDVIIGSRFLKKISQEVPFSRRWGNAIFSAITSLLVGHKITDATSGFQAVSGPVISFLAEELPSDYPDAEVIVLLCKMGYKVGEVSTVMRQRLAGKSMHSFWTSLIYPLRMGLALIGICTRVVFLAAGQGSPQHPLVKQ